MTEDRRSGCPINLTLEVVGDKWSLLIIRDMMFGNRRHYRELLTKSDEGISSNILADRLKMLLGQGILSREDDPGHKQKGIYSLTEQGIELLPILAQMAGWGVRYLPVSEELGIRAELLSAATYTVSPDSNRVAIRLAGPPLARRPGELPSEGTVLGGVQVPADGQPLVFLADHPTTVGYPVVAIVSPDDLWPIYTAGGLGIAVTVGCLVGLWFL